MFCRSVSWFVCTFVAVAIATRYSGQGSNTGSDYEVAVDHLRTDNLAHQPLQPAAPPPPLSHKVSTAAEARLLLQLHRPQRLTRLSRSTNICLWSLSPEEKTRRLMEAAEQGAVGELEALLAAGAEVGARDDYDNATALHWAALGGREEAARRLLAAGAAVDARETWQATPLHWAAANGRAAVVRLLLANNADHSAREIYGWTPLHLAARWGHTQAAAALLEAGADTGARNNSGDTPLDLARRYNKQQVVDLLEGSSSLTESTRRN